MAKQVGIIKLTGKLGDNSYYYTKNNGYLVRKITSVDAERIRNDPAFARVRENNTDFGRGAFGVKLIRAAFIPMFAGVADTHMTSRLTQAMMGVIQSDVASAPGMRRIELGNITLLRGFEFNNTTSLGRVVKASYHTALDLRKNACAVTLTPSAGTFVRRREGATHFRFLIGIATIDFKTGAHTVEYIRSTEMSVRKRMDAPLVFKGSGLPDRKGYLFVTLGVEYLQCARGEFFMLPGKKHTALTLIHAEKIFRRVESKNKALILNRQDTAPIRGTGLARDGLRPAVVEYGISGTMRRDIGYIYLLPIAVTAGGSYSSGSEALKGRDTVAQARAPARAWGVDHRRYPSPVGA